MAGRLQDVMKFERGVGVTGLSPDNSALNSGFAQLKDR